MNVEYKIHFLAQNRFEGILVFTMGLDKNEIFGVLTMFKWKDYGSFQICLRPLMDFLEAASDLQLSTETKYVLIISL